MSDKADKNREIPKWKKVYNVVSGILTGLIFIFLIFVIVIVIWQKKGGSDVNIFGYYMYEVLTDSMTPTIVPGDIILSEKTDGLDLKKGDIITFTAPSGPLAGQNVTHRVYNVVFKEDGVTVDYYETKGDAAPDNDEFKDNWKIYPSGVKAVFVSNLRALAAFRSFLMTPAGYIILIVVPLLAVGIMFIIGFVKDKTKQLAEEEAEKTSAKKVELSDLTEEEKRKLADSYFKNVKDNKSNEADPPAEEDGMSETENTKDQDGLG